MNKLIHFLLISCPWQGHINPALQLAKRLILLGAQVTFATTVHGLSKVKALPSHEGLSFASFSDGFDNGADPNNHNQQQIMAEMKRAGSQTLTDLIISLSDEGRPVTFLVYGLLLPWAADVANNMSIPSAFLCSQSATTFAIYHHFFNGHNGIFHNDQAKDPPSYIQLQGLPVFAREDLPSFLLPTSPHASIVPTIQQHVQALEKHPNPCVLFNTFDALEEEAIRYIADNTNINLITLGPLIPPAYLGQNNLSHSDTSFSCDLFDFDCSKNYTQWLNSKPKSSVVYVSFGSWAVLQKKQVEEIFHGLASTGRPFLWIVRSSEDGLEDMINENLDEEKGLIVSWCSQMEVLSHQSLGCFVTHCGWNSTLESLVTGVPVVSYPLFSDQLTNAKMVEEFWRTGIRVKVNEEGIVNREDIERCVEIVMGSEEKGEEIRRNAKKWKELALEAFKVNNGSSEINFRTFMERLGD